MCIPNSKLMTDLELMNLAKKRIKLRNTFKRHSKIYAIASIILAAMFIFADTHFLVITFVLAWGAVVALHGLRVKDILINSCPTVSDEYERLKTRRNLNG